MLPQVYGSINLEQDDISSYEASITEELPLLKEYAFDFKSNKINFKDGKPVVLEGSNALLVQNRKALMTDRFKYLGYSWNYGNEIKELIGMNLTISAIETEAKRLVEECLLVNPYNQSVSSVKATLEGKKVTLEVVVNTVYGEVMLNV